MFPVDVNTSKLWDAENSRRALQEIRTQAVADMRARDVSRGISAENGYKVYKDVDPDLPADQPGRYVIDWDLARLKHTATETQALVKARWAEFCSEPRDQSIVAERFDSNERKRTIKAAIKDGEAVIATLDDLPVRRTAGRPPGSRNKPKD